MRVSVSEKIQALIDKGIRRGTIKDIDLYEELRDIKSNVESLESISNSYNKLEEKIGKIYDEDPDPDSDGLIVIGEIAASHFKFL